MNGGPLAYPTAPLKKSALAASAQRAAELRAELGSPWVPEILRTKAASVRVGVLEARALSDEEAA